MSETVRIGVHNGTFHMDDAMFVAIIWIMIVAEYGTSVKVEVVRTRDRKILEGCDYVGDVLRIYDHEARRYDHHQPGGACPPRINGIPYAAAGLGWLHYAVDVIRAVLGEKGPWDNAGAERIARIVDERLIQGIDAADTKAASRPMATVNGTRVPVDLGSYAATIAALNPIPDFDDYSEAAQLKRFLRAVDVARELLASAVKNAAVEGEWSDRVEKADEGGPILVLSNPSRGSSAPWDTNVRDRQHVQFVVFPTTEGIWRVKAVKGRTLPNGAPTLLPAAWAGLEDEALQEVSGVADATFCHDTLWMAGAASREGAIALAQAALDAGAAPAQQVNEQETRTDEVQLQQDDLLQDCA